MLVFVVEVLMVDTIDDSWFGLGMRLRYKLGNRLDIMLGNKLEHWLGFGYTGFGTNLVWDLGKDLGTDIVLDLNTDVDTLWDIT